MFVFQFNEQTRRFPMDPAIATYRHVYVVVKEAFQLAGLASRDEMSSLHVVVDVTSCCMSLSRERLCHLSLLVHPLCHLPFYCIIYMYACCRTTGVHDVVAQFIGTCSSTCTY